MSQESATSKLKALLEWKNASNDDEVRTARTIAFRSMVSILRIQDTLDLITDLFVEDINISIGQLKVYFKEETEVSEVWSAANATKNKDLIGMCSILVRMKWEMFRTSRIFHVNAEIRGMMSILGYPRMAQESATSEVKALLAWRNASRDDEVRTARTTAFKDMSPPPPPALDIRVSHLVPFQSTYDQNTRVCNADVNTPHPFFQSWVVGFAN
ncbi:unnamed protein product [Hymenolepis diminuta]|uniref:BACK domain-containing protein n=1 Tax=Hymenolepis diminuta TaxID=6216 RepID=A0A0R3SX66_HYMDI|nr:unnamed protein product [Hymenolepis diminuta]